MKNRIMKAMTRRMRQVHRRFARDRRGVSAVEFALLAPVMIGLYIGCVEISDGVAADRKVSLIAATLANLPMILMATLSSQLISPLYSRLLQSGGDLRATFAGIHRTVAGFGAVLASLPGFLGINQHHTSIHR